MMSRTVEGLGTSPWGQRRHAQLGSRSESTTSPTALITSLDRAAPSRPIIPDAMSISRFSKAWIASHSATPSLGMPNSPARNGTQFGGLDRIANRRVVQRTITTPFPWFSLSRETTMPGRCPVARSTESISPGFSRRSSPPSRKPPLAGPVTIRPLSRGSRRVFLGGPLPHIPPERPEPRRHRLRALEQTHGWDARASKRWLIRRSTRSRSAPSRFLIPAGGRFFGH